MGHFVVDCCAHQSSVVCTKQIKRKKKKRGTSVYIKYDISVLVLFTTMMKNKRDTLYCLLCY